MIETQEKLIKLAHQYFSKRATLRSLTIPNNRPTNSPLANTAISTGVGLLTLASVIPAYQFAKSMREGYNEQAATISALSQASQAWDVVRQSREDDYLPLRTVLATKTDLLEEYRKKPRKRKRKL